MTVIRFSLLIILAMLVASCKPTSLEQQYKGQTSEQIFQQGQKLMLKHRYDRAAKTFEALETLYPFGPYAQQGQMDLIYAYYKNDDPASAEAAADRYIHLYPQADDVDYAYYMKGLVNFERGRTWLQKTFRVDQAENDLAYMHQAFIDFGLMLEHFPNSKYAADAQKRMLFARNILAQSELEAAQFYFRHKAYVAAVNRATFIVQHYQGAPQVVDALVLMVQSNRALGLDKPANDALRVLQTNYPNAPQLKKL